MLLERKAHSYRLVMGRSNLRICLGNLVAMRAAVILAAAFVVAVYRTSLGAGRSGPARATGTTHAFIRLNDREILALEFSV